MAIVLCAGALAGYAWLRSGDGHHAHSVMSAQAAKNPSENHVVDVFGTRRIDVHGQVHRLGVTDEVSPFILVFIDRDCPVSSRYAPELNGFHKRAEAAGVQFFGVVSDSLISTENARSFVRDFGFQFPVLWDPSGDLAMRVNPASTPEAFVISPANEVLYRGRIDNRFESITLLRRRITSHDLRDVLKQIGNGKQVVPRRTTAVGCYFEAWDNRAIPAKVTFTRHVAPIIAANCAECHREGSVAPFPLENYEQVKRRARMISFVTSQRIMPPWPAAKGFGHFRDERHLGKRQIDLLTAWARQGAPRGDPDHALPAPDWPSQDWLMGEPDLVIEMEKEFKIPAGGDDIYRYFVIPIEVLRDQHIVGLEFRPGDPRAVHHSLVYVDYTGKALMKDAEDEEYGFSVFGKGGFMDSSDPKRAIYLGGWAPGIDPIKLPSGYGVPFKAQSGHAVFEIHYRPTGKPTTDRSRIGLYFAKKPITHVVAGTVAGTLDVDIAPEDNNYWRQVYMDVPSDIKLIGVSPHMHYIGKEVKAIATLPDGSTVPLLHIPDWNFRWQNVYMYREPLKLPAGSRIDAWFKFDNSSGNPNNPHVPPGRVRWGWSSDEEMCELWMRFVADDPKSRNLVRNFGNFSWRRGAEPSRPPPE
ncbi:MAG: redoxin domain-containing protein [Hyphomicrobiaceae bacterium]